MTKYLFVFGHGYSKKNVYDTGCVYKDGRLTYTEQEMVRKLKPYLKKWADVAGVDVSFYDNNMFADRAIKNYKGYNVTEIHLDAPKGIGGHVIIDDQLEPDAQDKRLAAWIKATFETVGYVGADGINKRDNLYNVNQAQIHGINYRLLELFFLSNDVDRNYYLNNLDAVAKGLIEATIGRKVDGKVAETKPTVSKPVAAEPIKKPAEDAKLVIDGLWGSLTTRELQEYFKTPVDGIISGQVRNAITEKMTGVVYGKGGSLVIKALQKLVGAKEDGYLGVETLKKLQTFLGTPVDGELWNPSAAVKELQKQLIAGKLVSKVKPKAAAKPVVKGKLTVDGRLGKATISELQRYFNTPVDGEIWRPSAVVKAMQKVLGVKVDGLWGKETTKALQKRYGTPVDGVISNPSTVIKALQTALNNGKF